MITLCKRDQLISLRKSRNWSQQKVVSLLKRRYDIIITESYYGMIEQGSRLPSLYVALAISDLFKAEPSALFGAPKRKREIHS
ncbi:helix-turn-helix transcriptional regulator [Shouchella clausii]|uniref:helix-turn-helix transcriptional regulator n=1 Tax=Shouchella TaxID=2893057 RepID=UPI000D1F84E1|nr:MULTISPECIES: helix-turn-helix transcriptional regulator [Shouchella]MCY1106013.1 helix-turn-helix transcriptional regulator [Shouchella clausii]MCZ1181816.1 XRE family transcriptional regulator [Shouchella clausii]MDO7269945.1 helix-turn-helix transcriptional regulator [Shouchella clausii]MDO7285553.1 helix-turn-helix transcriptional regulator [Shouchella clausii]MDO7286986.1 helix-turn-helix transcriptional regulator [Shouchella clausii]